MSYFQNTRQVTRVELSDPAYWVDVCSEITYKEQKELADLAGKKTEASDQLLLTLVTDWNLDNEDGSKSEINLDNLNKIKAIDIDKIIDVLVAKLTPAEKKSSTKTP